MQRRFSAQPWKAFDPIERKHRTWRLSTESELNMDVSDGTSNVILEVKYATQLLKVLALR